MADTQEDLEKALAGGAKPMTLAVPTFYVSTINASLGSNEGTLTFSVTKPVIVQAGPNTTIQALTQEPVVVIQMSPETAKDLAILLTERVAVHEKAWGEISTEFTKLRASEAKK
jgi:hypothetical protein